jgi:ATP-dependent RNA helicase RhlE
MQDIERFIGKKVARLKLEGFPYLYTALFDEARNSSRTAVKGVRTGKGMSFGRHGKR